jgi:hypothetical protein
METALLLGLATATPGFALIVFAAWRGGVTGRGRRKAAIQKAMRAAVS